MATGPVKVVWAMVAYGPFPYAPVYTSHMRAIAYASRYFATQFVDGSCVRGAGSSDRAYTHAAENQVVQDFLDIPDATHIFMTEMDMILPDDILTKLVALDVDAASGVYFLRNGNGQPCLYKKTVTPASNPYPYSPVSLFPTTQPFRLNGCPGLGCVLIKRHVFERMERPWFDLKERNPRTGEGYGSDMYFWTNFRRAGFDVWVDPTADCCQIDYQIVGIADYYRRLREDPDFARQGYIIGAADAG